MRIFKELRSSTNKTFLTIYFDEQENWVYNNWTGYVSPDNVKQGALAVLEAFKNFKTQFGLNDNQELVGTWDQAVDWIEEEWIPGASEAGLRFYAHIVNQEAFAAASAADMLSRIKGEFTMKIFSNSLDAKQWLYSCKEATPKV